MSIIQYRRVIFHRFNMIKYPPEIRAYLITLQQEYLEGNLSEEDFNEILRQIYEGGFTNESK